MNPGWVNTLASGAFGLSSTLRKWAGVKFRGVTEIGERKRERESVSEIEKMPKVLIGGI